MMVTMKWWHYIGVALSLSSVACAAAAADTMPPVYRVGDFHEACEFMLEQAVECRKPVLMQLEAGTLSDENRDRLFFLLPNYRIAELRVMVTGDTYRVEPAYKSCVRMLCYARGQKDIKLTPTEQKALDEAYRILNTLEVSGKSATEIALAVHDWLVLHCEYDLPNANFNRKYGPNEYSPFDGKYLLLEHKGVCDSYVQAYWLLLQLAGVPCSMMSGIVRSENMGHAWNLVWLDDHWGHVDVTFDDPVPDRKGEVQHIYFDKTDAEMDESRTWDKELFPNTGGSGLFGRPVQRYETAEDFLRYLRSVKGACTCTVEIPGLRGNDGAERLRKAAMDDALPGVLTVGQDPLYPHGLRVHYRSDVPLTALVSG